MSSEDAPRSIHGGTEADPESHPTNQDQSNSNIKVNNSTKDDQKYTTEAYPQSTTEQPEGRRGIAKIKNPIARPAEFWIALFTAVLAFFTAILTVETAISLRILDNTDDALHQTARAANSSADTAERLRQITEANNRAWAAPDRAPSFVRFPRIGESVKVAMPFTNFGHSPATDGLISTRFDIVNPPPPVNPELPPIIGSPLDFALMESVPEGFCKDYPPSLKLPVVYPGKISTHNDDSDSDKIQWTEDLNEMKQLLRLRMCISYNTFGKTHYSWSCYIFGPYFSNGKIGSPRLQLQWRSRRRLTSARPCGDTALPPDFLQHTPL